MRAADIGTRRVIQLNETSSIRQAARTMRQHDVGCVVVTKNTLLGVLPSGIVTNRDLAVRILAGENDEDRPLGEIESAPLAVCRPDATIDELIDIMLGSHVRRLPIVDEDGRLVGIVCLDDVMAALAELMLRVSRAAIGERELNDRAYAEQEEMSLPSAPEEQKLQRA